MLWARALLIIGRIAYQIRKNGVAPARANVRKNAASATNAQRSRDRMVWVRPIVARIRTHTPRYSVWPLKGFWPEYRSRSPENWGNNVSISSSGGMAHAVAWSHPLETPPSARGEKEMYWRNGSTWIAAIAPPSSTAP